jgi:hypothetical protein
VFIPEPDRRLEDVIRRGGLGTLVEAGAVIPVRSFPAGAQYDAFPPMRETRAVNDAAPDIAKAQAFRASRMAGHLPVMRLAPDTVMD